MHEYCVYYAIEYHLLTNSISFILLIISNLLINIRLEKLIHKNITFIHTNIKLLM